MRLRCQGSCVRLLTYAIKGLTDASHGVYAHQLMLLRAICRSFRSRTRCHAIRLSASYKRSYVTNFQDNETEDLDFGEYGVILPAEPFVFGVSHIVPRDVPQHIVRPHYAVPGAGESSASRNERIALGGEAEGLLRDAARLAKRVREHAGSLVKIGVTTNEIDAAVHEYIIAHSAYPSPLHYSGFPRSCCTSINNIIAHGIPDDRPLEDGDIINIDITVYLNGFHGDTSQTFLVGDVDPQGIELVDIANRALHVGIKACGPGLPFKGIGQAIHDLCRGRDYSISPQFTGHGIGTIFHKPPWILHHRNDEPGVMMPGDCFTIEPCIIQGSNPRGWIFPDGWTASTENCARSAQAEHMVLITEHGADILTQ